MNKSLYISNSTLYAILYKVFIIINTILHNIEKTIDLLLEKIKHNINQTLPKVTVHFYARYINACINKSYTLVNHQAQLRMCLDIVTVLKLNRYTCKRENIQTQTNRSFPTPNIITCTDYYPFGMAMGGRNGSVESYRYSYQGSEKDDEIKGQGNYYTTFFRGLDPRLGKWLSVDPKTSSLPWQSPYCSMDNNPVWFNDVLGDKIKSDRINKKESLKQKKEVEKTEVRKYEKTLATSLEKKTGLKLSFDDDGYLTYAKDKNGKPIFNGGSEDARNDLIKGIDDNKFVYSIGWLKGSSEIDGGNSTRKSYGDHFGFVQLDMNDFSLNDPETYDLGMVFLHEYNHGYFGLKDNYTPAIPSSTTGKPDLYKGTGIHKLGTPGETVLRVNTYREQLGLAKRLTYEAINGKILFSKSYINNNNKKKDIYYYYLPAFNEK